MGRISGLRVAVMAGLLALAVAPGLRAQDSGDGVAASEAPVARPAADAAADAALPPRNPNEGPVTHLPLPRYVSLKTGEGNARRGPGLTHRIDWVFTRAGMPLKVTAEFEHWRRVEDQDGAGGWVHYSLLSGVRAVLVTTDMAEFHDTPDASARVAYQAEMSVIGKLLECDLTWCRVSVDGEKGWALKSDLWGVDPDEVVN
jgi:SH3-like domain-containing protein